MGRGTEFFDYITRDREPTPEEKEQYCNLSITQELKQLRRSLAKVRKKGRQKNDV